jgi:hypothetical protein
VVFFLAAALSLRVALRVDSLSLGLFLPWPLAVRPLQANP